MDAREANLPKWARDLIKELRDRVKYATEPLVSEVAKLRTKTDLQERKLGALTELITCAAKGGHLTSVEIINVLESYSLTVSKD